MSRPLRQAERVGRAVNRAWSHGRIVLRSLRVMRERLAIATAQMSESSENPVEAALLGELKGIDKRLESAAHLVASVGGPFNNVAMWLPRKEDRRG